MSIDNGRAACEINVTPLIDVLLVLLIIFMVIVPALPYGLPAELPRHSPQAGPSHDAVIVVQILAAPDGRLTYLINEQRVVFSDLGTRLSAIFAARADRALAIRGDDKLDYSAVAQVVNLARASGADHIRLITPKDGI